MTRINPDFRKPPKKEDLIDLALQKKAKKPLKPRPRINKKSLKREVKDEEYLALRIIYLEQNPHCVLCGQTANSVHHIVRGVAGRAKSLLNSDTWIGACVGPGTNNCHSKIEGMSIENQIALKQSAIYDTIIRLRS